MSIRDMTLFGAFTGGISPLQGGYFIQGGGEIPPVSHPETKILQQNCSAEGEKYFGRARKRQRIPFSKILLPRKVPHVLELIQTQMAQKPMLRAEEGMRVRCANKASAE